MTLTCMSPSKSTISQGRQHELYGCRPSTTTTSCGNISISYPFRLRGGESSACTDPLPLFELVCEANNAVLYDHHENKYHVKEISYDEKTVRLVDADLASGDCRLPRRNSSDDVMNRLLFNGTALSYARGINWLTFVSCSREINGRDAYIPLPCLSTNDSIVYAIFALRADSLFYLEPSCHSTAITRAEDTSYGYDPVEQSDVFQILQKGFLLTWDPGYYCR